MCSETYSKTHLARIRKRIILNKCTALLDSSTALTLRYFESKVPLEKPNYSSFSQLSTRIPLLLTFWFNQSLYNSFVATFSK